MSWLADTYRTTLGKKLVMAVTGTVLLSGTRPPSPATSRPLVS